MSALRAHPSLDLFWHYGIWFPVNETHLRGSTPAISCDQYFGNIAKNVCIEIQKISLAIFKSIMYYIHCCDMIAVKREVAAVDTAGFPWSECQGRPKMAGAGPINWRQVTVPIEQSAIFGSQIRNKCRNDVRTVCAVSRTRTGVCTVTACRTS